MAHAAHRASGLNPVRLWILLSLALLHGVAMAAPKAELWARWERNDPASNRVLNHTLWARFLKNCVVTGSDGITRVRYADMSSDDRGFLRVYLDELQRTEVSKLRREEQRAFWINLYNAQTLKYVMERYPVASILDLAISPGFFAKGPWGAKLMKVEDETLSLDDIEHRILRPIWKDPRLHYALNCASLGCPNLAPEPYTASNTEALLDTGARAFVNHPRGARVDEGRLYVSSIYEWFAADFGGKDRAVIEHLRLYAEPPLAAQLQLIEKISGDAYDWSLNDVRESAR